MVTSTPFPSSPLSSPPPPSLPRPSNTMHPLDEHDEESATATLLRKRDGSADPSLPPLFSLSTTTTTASPAPIVNMLGSSSAVPAPTTSSSSSSTTSSTTSNYQDTVFISGAHADFVLLGTNGIGGSDANMQISLALREKRPDILIVQLCSTRLRLLLDPDASIWSYLVDVNAATSNSSSSSNSSSGGFSTYHPFAGAAPVLNFSRGASLVIARVVWKALALLVGQRRTLAQEYVHGIRLAAASPSPAQHTRVVLGDRDLPTTLSRAWHLLTLQERFAVLAELVLLSLPPFLPARTACRLLGLSPPFLLISRGSDATAEVLHFFSQRHPSLAPLQKEGGDYFLSSLQKLDQPRFGREGGGREGGGAGDRAVVLAVVGASSLPYLQAHWGEVVDRRRLVSLRRGGGRGGGAGGGGGWAWLCVGVVVLVIVTYMLCQGILFLSAPPQKTFGVVRKSNPSMTF